MNTANAPLNVEEYLIEAKGIHLELMRLAERYMTMVESSCAEPSNHAFMSLLERQSRLHQRLIELDGVVTTPSSGPVPLWR
jgi:hypothetical protein